jgi:thiol-disulfide isomerase/thioredoxin
MNLQYGVGVLVSLLIGILIYIWYTKSRAKEAFEAPKPEKKLLLFYADWCPHCKTFKPMVADFARRNHILIDLLEDATTPNTTKEEYAIKGYPTLYFVNQQGSKFEFRGPRTTHALDEFVQANDAN